MKLRKQNHRIESDLMQMDNGIAQNPNYKLLSQITRINLNEKTASMKKIQEL